jgi:hypothetical protein
MRDAEGKGVLDSGWRFGGRSGSGEGAGVEGSGPSRKSARAGTPSGAAVCLRAVNVCE